MKYRFFTLAIALILCFKINAQVGVSTGSFSAMKNKNILKPQNIFIEDFINYHKHQINIPTEKDVAISIDYNNTVLNDENEFILQVGIATQNARYRKKKTNVNVSIVLDKSGSMSGTKMELVKQAIISFIEKLSSEATFSLVQFDSKAEVLIENTEIGNNLEFIKEQINTIYASGGTNLNAGMVKGYEEALKKHSHKINSRVILLTDGMTNEGETNFEKILKNSKKYNSEGVEISTIGVGSSLDFNLLKQLAIEGNGSNHFIGDTEEDIQKVFVDEAQSLLYQIGKNPTLTVKLPHGFEIRNLYGYQPKRIASNIIEVPLENLNAGQTQVIIMKIKANGNKGAIKTEFNYLDSEKENQKLNSTILFNTSKATTNKGVCKNYHIALMAFSLKKAIKEYENANYGNMKTILQKTKKEVEKYSYNDSDITRVKTILDEYCNIQIPKNIYLQHK